MREVVKKENITFTGTVVSVNQQAASCDITDANGLTYYDVRLRAAIDGKRTGVVVYPSEGSSVVVGRIGHSNQLFVIKHSAADLLSIRSEKESLKQILSDLLDAINQITVPTGTGPSGTPVNAVAFSQIKKRLNNILKE